MVEQIQRRANKMIPQLRDLSYEEHQQMWLNNPTDKEVKRR